MKRELWLSVTCLSFLACKRFRGCNVWGEDYVDTKRGVLYVMVAEALKLPLVRFPTRNPDWSNIGCISILVLRSFLVRPRTEGEAQGGSSGRTKGG